MDLPAILSPMLSGDFALVALAALLAGIVRGFSGFGTALVFLPIAGIVLDPVSAVATVALMDLAGPVPVLVRVRKDVHGRDLARLVGGAIVALPLGLFLLTMVSSSIFRVTVSGISLAMLVLLMAGWRYRGALPHWGVVSIGGASGFLGGIAGVPGPPVIFAYMASTKPARVIRANISTYLYAYDWSVVMILSLAGRIDLPLVVSGLVLTLPNMVGNLTGAALFSPERERVFRAVAYVLIAGVALAGLPFWNWGE
jgi:uncharacterized membrane protein YfcA